MLSVRTFLFACLAVASLVLVAAACGDDDDEGGSAASAEDLQKTQVLAAMVTYRAEALHQIDDDAQEASEIEAGWSGAVTRMRQVTAGVDWPGEFAEHAVDLESELGLTAEAIDADDLAGVKEHISLAHDAWHEFEEQAYAYIAGEEPPEEEDHDEESSPTGG